jgi:hypothetical protein
LARAFPRGEADHHHKKFEDEHLERDGGTGQFSRASAFVISGGAKGSGHSMGVTRLVAAVSGAAVLAAGLTVAAVQHGDDSPHKKSAPQVTAAVTPDGTATTGGAQAMPGSATAQDVVKDVLGLTQQLQQAANNGGQPRPLTKEEVDALLKAQLQKLGVKQ